MYPWSTHKRLIRGSMGPYEGKYWWLKFPLVLEVCMHDQATKEVDEWWLFPIEPQLLLHIFRCLSAFKVNFLKANAILAMIKVQKMVSEINLARWKGNLYGKNSACMAKNILKVYDIKFEILVLPRCFETLHRFLCTSIAWHCLYSARANLKLRANASKNKIG